MFPNFGGRKHPFQEPIHFGKLSSHGFHLSQGNHRDVGLLRRQAVATQQLDLCPRLECLVGCSFESLRLR